MLATSRRSVVAPARRSAAAGFRALSARLAAAPPQTQAASYPDILYPPSMFAKCMVLLMQDSQEAISHLELMNQRNCISHRRPYSVLKEFSKHLKGEVKSNSELQQSIKDLNEKIGIAKEDLKVRTQKTTEKLYQSVDEVWTEAEAASKKVAENVKEKISAAKEEVKETLGLGEQEPTVTSHSSTDTSATKDETKTSGADNSQNFEAENLNESPKQDETLFSKFKSAVSSASPSVSATFQKLKETKIPDYAKQGYNIVKDELSSKQKRRKHIDYATDSSSSGPRSTRTDIVAMPSKKSRLSEKWESFKKKMQDHPMFNNMKTYSGPVVTKGQELAEDMRERWETSDHPVVHKIQDLNETVFGETATALSFKEIRRRDPSFSLPDFLVEVQEMIQPVLSAYFKCDVEILKKYCCSEVIERCKGERAAYDSQGIFFENKILHISEADVRETKMMGNSPIIIVAFQTQQIFCIRDREGSITAGGKDMIQSVYYAWAMQQIDAEELGEGAYYPVWKLRDMQQLNVQALI